jgi:hypothetical protein
MRADADSPAALPRSTFQGMTATWIVQRTASPRFPFRVSIEQGGRLVVAVRAQAAWPGPGQQIFCVRERELDPAEFLEPLERVPIATLTQVGRKLTIVLDRPVRKRCELLTVTRPRRDGGGSYERIFFRTESGIRAHRSKGRVEVRTAVPFTVAIDSGERYPWRFPGATAERRKLRVGDYALMDGDRVTAVVERKSFDNILTDFSSVQALHQQLADLASCDAAALVIEAEFGDFLDPDRLRGRWPAAHAARVLAELSALHPRLPIVFAGNRKLANLWTHRFFAARAAEASRPQLELVREVGARYHAVPRGEGLDAEIRAAVLGAVGGVELAELAKEFPGVPRSRIRRVLHELRERRRVRCTGRGPRARWEAAPEGGALVGLDM